MTTANWKTVFLPEVTFFQEGPGVRKNQFRKKGIKLLNVGNLVNNKLETNNTETFISEEEATTKYKHFLVDEGDLVIASSGIFPDTFRKKVAFAKKENIPLCMNTSTIRFKSINPDVLDLRFFRYFLMTDTFANQVRKFITGSAQLNFGPSHLKKMIMPLPSIKVQKEITEILEKVENIKQRREQANQMTNKLLQAVFLQMFGEPLSKDRFKLKKITELTSFVSYGFTRPMPHFANGVPIITSKNVSEGKIDFYNIDYTDEQSFSGLSKKDCPIQGDILYTKDGRIGEASAVRTSDKFCISQAVAVLRPLKEALNPIFFETLLNSKSFRNVVHNMAYGVALKHISITKLKQISIIVPPMELQDRLVTIVERIDEIMLKQRESTINIDNLFATVISKAFRGELVRDSLYVAKRS
jgi:type I restriction enzyme, S subunit